MDILELNTELLKIQMEIRELQKKEARLEAQINKMIRAKYDKDQGRLV